MAQGLEGDEWFVRRGGFDKLHERITKVKKGITKVIVLREGKCGGAMRR